MIVVWDESVSKFSDGYSNRATIAGKHYYYYKDGRDIEVDVPNWGTGLRKCRECPPGTLNSKKRRNPKFKQITCKQCPRGMVSSTLRAALSWA